MHRRNKRTYSFRKRVFLIIYSLYFTVITILLSYTIYLTNRQIRTAEDETRQMLSFYNGQVYDNLFNASRLLYSINTYSTDISLLATGTDRSELYGNITRATNTLKNTVYSFSYVRGLFAYFPRIDTFINAAKSSAAEDTWFPEYLRSHFRNDPLFVPSLTESRESWTIRENEGHFYLIRLIVLDGGYVGAWTTLDTILDGLADAEREEYSPVFLTENGTPVGSNSDALSPVSDADFPTGHFNVQYQDTSCVLVAEPLRYCNLCLGILIPRSYLTGLIYPTLILVLALLLASMVLMFFLVRYVQLTISKPLDLLQTTASAIASGDVKHRIDTANLRAKELLEISDSFNGMVDSIEQLRIDIYEEKLQKQKIEMYCLQSQVSPHFFINCLNLIGLLADGTPEHTKILNQMIAQLSRHLRYTLRAKSEVSLREELEHEKNYIEMTKLRFPGCLTVRYEIADEVLDASVFPLILIGFTENTFKYNMVMGKPLTLIVQGRLLHIDGQLRVRLVHIDSGSGFSEDVLGEYQSLEKMPPSETGHRIGIWNAWKRFQLIFGETASLKLSNEPGMGARIDMDFPYRSYEKHEAIQEGTKK
ncbi:MAG: histidine kinase [Firmicutes bacterium]|nr:histidine kinase [Bacillota bacterium]